LCGDCEASQKDGDQDRRRRRISLGTAAGAALHFGLLGGSFLSWLRYWLTQSLGVRGSRDDCVCSIYRPSVLIYATFGMGYFWNIIKYLPAKFSYAKQCAPFNFERFDLGL